MTKPRRLIFVVMPWHTLHLPSLAAGILTTIVHEHSTELPWEVETCYANLHWAEYLEQATDGFVTPDKYQLLGEDLFFQATGEWTFSPALYGGTEFRVDEYRRAFLGPPEDFELALAAHRVSNGFVDKVADELLARGPDVIGLTSVFQQNLASLALARRIKEKVPQIVTMMGGANCDGVQGPALHRNFPFLDYVFSGEADIAFREFLEHLDGARPIEQVSSVSWRDETGASRTNKHGPLPKPSDFPIPYHDDYFAQAMESGVSRYIEPNVITESARGCWWGQKHHCTFCGLNGLGMTYRSKNPDVFLEELEYLIRRHQSLDVVLADNILDMKYLTTVLPTIKARGWDVRIHYEIKANLKRDQLELLRDAGVWHVQPGIESLSTKVLKLMEKGTTGPQNVKLLRECEELNLTATWNMLAGFPGEDEEDYRRIQAQLPALVHLQPPSGATRLALERFSPFFNDAKLGFAKRWPSLFYSLAYDLPQKELRDIVYIFDDEQHGVTDRVIDDMQRAVEKWRAAYRSGCTLTQQQVPEGLLIRDQRIGWERRDFVLSDPIAIDAYLELSRPLTYRGLEEAVTRNGRLIDTGRLDAILAQFRQDGLIFEDDGLMIALATKPIPFRLRLAA